MEKLESRSQDADGQRKLRIDVWSDVACPWCYIGKRRLEAALALFPHAVEIHWRAFELDPSAPLERDNSAGAAARVSKKYGIPIAQAEASLRKMTETAADDGLEIRFDRIRSGNTFDAHRVLHLAAERGVQGAVKERLLRAYMTEGELLGDHEVLARLGGEAGLDANEVRTMLASDTYVRDVRADEDEARALGINGVPFFAVAGRYGVSGAQTPDVLADVLARAWEATGGLEIQEGAVCDGPDGCA